MKALRVGEKVRCEDGSIYRVDLVNDCRARLTLVSSVSTVRREFDTADGRHLVFEQPTGPRNLDVSPYSFFSERGL